MSTKADLGPSAFAKAEADRHTSNLDTFQRRHIGPDAAAQDEMLRSVGVPSVDALIEQTIPSGIRFTRPLDLPPAESEAAA